MNAQEAIEILKFYTDEDRREYYQPDFVKAHEMAIAAIEKRIPKKPEKIRSEFFDINGEWDLLCPTCTKDLTPTYRHGYKPAYCDKCGQAIDWSENR